ncbi:MAG: hypothetical protein KF774_11825 [Planctomyces sp.]|nr:hypothetical protein [Planctomyces sp.]
MPEAPRRRSPTLAFLLKRRPFEHEISLFLLASLLDFFMTYWMLSHRPGEMRFIESNPAARYFLDHWGVKGLLGFKLAAVLVVVLSTALIAERRPAWARAILWLGIAGTALVVLYSFSMFLRHR